MFKFKKGDLVSINFEAFCSIFASPDGNYLAGPVEYHKVTNYRMTNNGIEYKLRGCYGWWKEEHLVAAQNQLKTLYIAFQAQGPTTYITY